MNQQINIKKISNHYHFLVATDDAGQISKQLDSNLQKYLIQSLEQHIQNKLQTLGYTENSLIAIRRINIHLTISNDQMLTTTSGMSHIASQWVNAIANGFMHILSCLSHHNKAKEALYNDLIAVFPDQISAESVYFEHIITQSALPWWINSLFVDNPHIQSVQHIVSHWLLTSPKRGAVLLTELTEKQGIEWLDHLNRETIATLLLKLIEQDDTAPFSLFGSSQTSSLSNRAYPTKKQFSFTGKEKERLKQCSSFESLIFLVAIFIRSKQEEFARLSFYNELVWTLLSNLPELEQQYAELRIQSRASKKIMDNNKVNINKLVDAVEQDTDTSNFSSEQEEVERFSFELKDKSTKALSQHKSIKTGKNSTDELSVEAKQRKRHHAEEAVKEKLSFAEEEPAKTKQVKQTETTAKSYETPQVETKNIAESYPTGCGGLLFLVRQAIRLLPDPVHSEANVKIMQAVAILCLQELVSLLSDAQQRATWQREAYLIQAFAGLHELPKNFSLEAIDQQYQRNAQHLLDQLIASLSDEICHGKHAISYFFSNNAPVQLSPLQNLLLRPARLLVNGVYITLEMPFTDIDIGLRKQGWDIDPGWIPQINRVIRFKYRESI